MTTNYTAEIHCDRCGNWMLGAVGPKPTGLATKAVKEAKKVGWSRDVKSLYADLCPSCLIESRRESAGVKGAE
jgi:hypothetical protein